MNREYSYTLEEINVVSGERKRLLDYTSSVRLREGSLHFKLDGLPVGAYRVLKVKSDGEQG